MNKKLVTLSTVEKDTMKFMARVKHVQMVAAKHRTDSLPWRCYITLESMDDEAFKMWDKFKDDETGQVLINAWKVST